MTDNQPVHVVVIGGGISGLAAAWALARNDLARPRKVRALRTQVTLLESSSRLGGKIQTTEFAGRAVDNAADAFLTRVPWASHLCHELGMTKELVAPSRSRARVWTRGKLRAFPAKHVLGVPANPAELFASGVISKAGLARAAADYALPEGAGRDAQYPTVGHLVGTRLGREVLDRIVDPLVGGINAGRCDDLDLEACAPAIAEAAAKNSSLMRGVSSQLRSTSTTRSGKAMFNAPLGGMEMLVRRLAGGLRDAGANLRTNTDVIDLFRENDKWHVVTRDGERITADGVLVATPAHVSADLLANACGSAASILRGVRHASVAMVRLSYETSGISVSTDGSGFVVPAVDGRLITAASWASSKWSHLAVKGRTLVRASVGRIDDPRFANMSDEELTSAVNDELSGVMGIVRPPVEADVTRWSNAFPQYEPGHISRMLNVERAIAEVPGLAVAGAAIRGLGIPACIRTGRDSAEELLTRLSESRQPHSVL